jgi:hypothetical protein
MYGYHSYMAWDPGRKIGVAVLANAAVNIDNVGCQLIRRLPLTPVQVDPKLLASYAGRYQLSNSSARTIHVDGTRIFLQVPNEAEYELFAASKTHFYYPVFDFEITFYRNDRGEVDRIEGLLFGETYKAKKVP